MAQTPTNDHDILITLVAEVKGLREDIKEIKDGTTLKISDHETRLRRLEWFGAIAVGLSYALQFYFNYLR
jgi:hypothetical protein